MYVVGFGAVGIGRLLLTLKVDNFMAKLLYQHLGQARDDEHNDNT